MEFRLADVLRTHARERGDATMLRFGSSHISFATMDARSNAVADALAAEGVTRGTRVAHIDKNGVEFWEVLFAAAKLGAVLVSVNWRLAPAEMAFICDDAQAQVLVVGPDFVSAVEDEEASLPTVKKIVAIGEHPHWERYSSWSDRPASADPQAATEFGDAALQLYTSGTTGMPKGALITHANLAALMPEDGPKWELSPDAVSLVVMPLFHIAGCGWALAGMAQGAESVLEREFDPVRTLDLLAGGVTHAFLVPVMLQVLTSTPGAEDRDFSRLRHIVYGASPITEAVLLRALQTFRHTQFSQVYGLTETTGAITQLEHADHDPGGARSDLLRSAGKPWDYVELRIVDPASEEALPTGQVGELWTRSQQNADGYWHKPDDTASAFTDGGWFRTGDAGYLDDAGYLFLTDRIKDLIVSGGENVYPIEVENVLSGHPDVVESAVIGVPSEKWGETVKAVVVTSEASEVTAEQLIDYCRNRIAHYKCPTSIDFADSLPRNPSGKLLKRDLRAPYWEGQQRSI